MNKGILYNKGLNKFYKGLKRGGEIFRFEGFNGGLGGGGGGEGRKRRKNSYLRPTGSLPKNQRYCIYSFSKTHLSTLYTAWKKLLHICLIENNHTVIRLRGRVSFAVIITNKGGRAFRGSSELGGPLKQQRGSQKQLGRPWSQLVGPWSQMEGTLSLLGRPLS